MDYRPIDLTAHANAADDLAVPVEGQARHQCLLRGLPFTLPEKDGRARVMRVEPGVSLDIAVGAWEVPARTITFAHRTRGPWRSPAETTQPGKGAVYTFTFADGGSVSVAIRQGFEIESAGLDWGHPPSLAVPEHTHVVPDRQRGAFADAGLRQTELGVVGSPRYYLWSWINPRPTHAVTTIHVDAPGMVIDIGGICVGFIDEDPLQPEPGRVVVADLPSAYSGDGSDLALEVDRGTVGYTTALAGQKVGQDGLSAWALEPDMAVTSIYARVSSLGSGTVRLVTADGTRRSQVQWADLRAAGVAGVGGLRITESGRNWVRTKIVDDATGEPVPCRVSFSSPDGVPYQPHGHPHHVNSDLPSWHMDVGNDVRLGRTTYAYVDGACEGWLPRGRVRARIAKGFDYEPIDDVVTVDDETRELTLRVKRLFDPTAAGWYSGDTHVHFVSSFGGLAEAAAEGVSVVHLLQSQWGSLFTNAEDFVGRPISSADGKTILFTSQENRQHFLGHLSLLGLKKPVMPLCTDGPDEAEIGGGLETTLSDWADRCRDQGGTVVLPHFPLPLGEQATLIVTDRVDAIESLGVWQDVGFSHYYRYLNAGYRLPISGGTDKMSSDVPIGICRTYVRLAEDEEFGFDAWCGGLKAGRSYMSSGPLLDLSVDGATIGDTLELPARGATVSVRARARSIFPMFRLELVRSGRVIASSECASGAHELRLDEDLAIEDPGWICVRVGGGGPEHLTQHRDEWRRSIMAHSSPIYLACGERRAPSDGDALEEMMTLVERGRAYVEHRSASMASTGMSHHHGGDHGSFLLRPFDHARSLLAERLREVRG